MIYVTSGAMQNEIIHLLENTDAELSYTFVSKKGLKLAFEVNTEDLEKAVDLAKKIIKESDLGKTLYFQVTQ